MIPVITVLILILLTIIVGRVATTALTLTGMSHQAARFQARSALTGAGFTTSESEAIVNHPVRRRIVRLLMLLGSAGIVSVIAGVMLTFVRAGGSADLTVRLLLLVGGMALLLWLMRFGPVDRGLQRLIDLGLRRYTDLVVRDVAALLEIGGGFAISELGVEPTDWLADRQLAELRLPDEGVLVLGVQRSGGVYVGAPRGDIRVHAGDTLVIYGHRNRLADLDQRHRGPAGERAHAEATVDQRHRELRQAAEDQPPTSTPPQRTSVSRQG